VFYRLPDTEVQQPELYKKDKLAALFHGSNFKYQFCGLVFVQMRNSGYSFKLASTVKGLGKFDVVVEFSDENCRKSHIFVQINTNTTQSIKLQKLLSDSGDFSLRKYYKSYIQIEEKFSCGELGVKIGGSVDDSLFILYTNAKVGNDLQSNTVTDIGEERFLMTGGSVLQFNEQKHKPIYGYLQNLPRYREFLSRFRIFYCQAGEDDMKEHIEHAPQQSIRLHGSELDKAYMQFLDVMKKWCQHKNYVLKDTNSRKYDPLWKTEKRMKTIR
jgi:hypothetical protein